MHDISGILVIVGARIVHSVRWQCRFNIQSTEYVFGSCGSMCSCLMVWIEASVLHAQALALIGFQSHVA